MKENQNDDLFQLIKSMSRTEKRYFKVDAQKGSSSYIKLFDALNSMDEYDEERLQKKLKGEGFLNRLGTEKNYLYYAILKSMRSYWSEKSAYSRIKEMILNANYLLDRGLYEQSGKMLKKAKKLAIEFEQPASVLEINKLERTVYSNLELWSLNDKVEKLVAEKKKAMELLNQEMQYSDSKYLIFSNFVRQKQLIDESKILELKSEFSLEKIKEEEIESTHAKYEFHQAKNIYFQLLGQFDKAFDSQAKVIEWWEANSEYKKEEFPKFITDLSNFISASFSNQRFDLIPSIIDKIEKEVPENFHGERIKFQNLALFKLVHFLNEGEFEAARKYIDTIESKFGKYYIDKKFRASIFGNISILYFILEQFQNCNKWISKMIEYKRVKERQDVQRFIRVLKIICHYELDELDEFDNSCRATLRYIEGTTTEKTKTIEYEVIHYLKKISSVTLEKLPEELQSLKQFILDKKNSPREFNAHGLDEYLFWVESKISKKSMIDSFKDHIKSKR